MNCSYISNFVLNYQIGLHRTTISQLLFLFINFQYNILSHQYVKKTKIIILVNIYSWGTFKNREDLIVQHQYRSTYISHIFQPESGLKSTRTFSSQLIIPTVG